MQTIIKTEGLTKLYREKPALSDFHFELREGDVCGLIGKNGAGKTTLMKLIAGQIFPTRGQLMIYGAVEQAANSQRKRIGTLIDNGLFENFTAEQNLEYFRRQRGIPNKGIVRECLEMVGLSHTGKKKFGQFSTGMKQRLGLALALLSSPDVLILDEPTNGLDPEGIVNIRRLLQKLNRERGVTILISSHILRELQDFSTRFVMIDGGRQVGDFTKEDFERMSEQKLLVRAEDPSKVAASLEQEYPGTEYLVMPENWISVDPDIDSSELIRKLTLRELRIYEVKMEHITLEQHFLNMVGGAK